MKLIFEAAQEVQDFFDSKDWQFCFIGGVALQRWARPRLTNDVDLTLLTGFGSEEIYIDSILSKFESRIESPKEFSLKSRVVLLKIEMSGLIFLSAPRLSRRMPCIGQLSSNLRKA